MPAAVQTSVAPTRTAPQRERKPAPAREASAAVAMGAPVTHLAEGRVSCACGGGCPRCRRRTTAVPDSVHRALASPGWPIPQPLREQAESFFGTDFAHIRLHADAIAATAAAESRAHAIVSGHHILLSRQRRDLALPAAQRTLAHELTHTLTLQPASVSAGTFESDTAPCETAAVAASRAFTPGAVASPSVAAPSCRARGICREPDPRLDALVQLIEDLPLTLIPSGIAEELHAAAPELDLHDPDNYEPLRLLIDGRFGSGAADEVFSIWIKLREDLSAAPSPPPESSQSELEIQTSGGDAGFSEPGSTGIPHGSTSDRPSTASSRFAVEALRFPDDMIVAFTLPAGVNVTVLYISGDLLRIQWIDDTGGDHYGWVPYHALAISGIPPEASLADVAATLGIPYEPLPTSPLPVGPAESIKSAAGKAALDDLEMAHESWEIESAGAEPHLTAASTAIADLWDPALESLGYPNLRNWKGDLRRHPDWPFEELAPKGVDDANFLRIADQVDSLFIAIGDLIDFVPGDPELEARYQRVILELATVDPVFAALEQHGPKFVYEQLTTSESTTFGRDLLASIWEAPSHVPELLGDVAHYIYDNLDLIVFALAAFLLIQTGLGMISGTGIGAILAVLFYTVVILILGYFAKTELDNFLGEAEAWWRLCEEANGDSEIVSEASRAFVRMLGHMVLIILTLAGIRVGVGAIGRTPLPIRSASTARLALRDYIEMVEVKPGVWIAEGTEAEYLAQKAVTTPAGSRTPPLRSDTTPPLSEATRQPPMKTASAVAEEGEATKIATTAEAGKLEEASSSRGPVSEFSDVPESTWPHEFWPDDMESLPTPSTIFQVDAANIRGTKPEFLLISRFGKPALKWSLYDEASRAKFCEIYTPTADGKTNPEGGPELWLHTTQALLPSGKRVIVKPNGFRWTADALFRAIRGFREIFGHMPENLSGDLAADNLAKFQRVFDRIHSEHVEWTGDKIADEAVKETTFGMTRIEVGYGKLHAIISDFGPAQGLTWVPRTVRVEAFPTEGTPSGIP